MHICKYVCKFAIQKSIECGNPEIQDRNRMGIEIENQNENSEIVIEIAQESRNRK